MRPASAASWYPMLCPAHLYTCTHTHTPTHTHLSQAQPHALTFCHADDVKASALEKSVFLLLFR